MFYRHFLSLWLLHVVGAQVLFESNEKFLTRKNLKRVRDGSNAFGNHSYVFPADHCAYDIGSGWPKFDTEQELQRDEYWAGYFTTVYGSVPSSGYPICTGAFSFIWQAAANTQEVGTAIPCSNAENPTGQHLPDGSYYTGLANWDARGAYGYIANSKLLGVAVPAQHWVEVSHTIFSGDIGSTWFYLSVGSGVWFNVGNTRAFDDHPAAVQFFMNVFCDDGTDDPNLNISSPVATECNLQVPKPLCGIARSKGYDSIQFTHHNDCTCGPTGQSSSKFSRRCMTEIVDLNTDEGATNACAPKLKGGWDASEKCDCQEGWKTQSQDGQSVGYSNCGQVGSSSSLNVLGFQLAL